MLLQSRNFFSKLRFSLPRILKSGLQVEHFFANFAESLANLMGFLFLKRTRDFFDKRQSAIRDADTGCNLDHRNSPFRGNAPLLSSPREREEGSPQWLGRE